MPSNSVFSRPELLFSVSETLHLSPLLVPLLVCGTTRCGDVSALELVTMAFFYFPMKVHSEMRPWPAEPTHQSSLAEIPGVVVGMGSGELAPKSPQVPFQGKNQIWFALVLLYYAPVNSGLLLFKLPAHQKGWIGAN